VVSLAAGVDIDEARSRLEAAGGNAREALRSADKERV